MSYESDSRERYPRSVPRHPFDRQPMQDGPRYRDEIYSKRVPAGRRTYFFDVKSTKSGEDFFIVVTESKRVDEHRYEKHKIFLYKEDFAKFLRGLHDVMKHISEERLPDYDFGEMPLMEYMPRDGEGDS